jgi:lipoprotein-anchoring transpeptidase ErfK/SrfK
MQTSLFKNITKISKKKQKMFFGVALFSTMIISSLSLGLAVGQPRALDYISSVPNSDLGYDVMQTPQEYALNGSEATVIEEGSDLPLVAEAASSFDPDKGCANTELYCKSAFQGALQDSNGSKMIFISLKAQKMVSLENGQILVETHVTTGRRGFRTPAGNFQVRNKLENIVLRAPRQFRARGINYNLKVKKWLGIGSGYGIHDAYWRSRYGGQDFNRSGSHGCINTPLEAVNKIFDWAEVGTRVVIS